MSINVLFFAALSLSLVHASTGKAKAPADVLFIGDSHSTLDFGKGLARMLNEEYEGSYAGYAYSGTIAQQWVEEKEWQRKTLSGYCKYGVAAEKSPRRVKCEEGRHVTPKLSGLIEMHEPKRIIVQLGTNYLGRSRKVLKETVTKLLEVIKKQNPMAECFWVGAPDTGRPERKTGMGLSTVIAETKALVEPPCTFIDSGPPVTEFPKGWKKDSLHFKGKKGREQVDRWLKQVRSVLFPEPRPINPYPGAANLKNQSSY